MSAVKPIPCGYHSVTPSLVVKGAKEAIAFDVEHFGAVEHGHRMEMPDGRIGHAEIRLGDSLLHVADEFPEWGIKSPLAHGGSAVTLHLYVEDADAVFTRAVEAGATVKMPMNDAFWGDRYGKLADPFGHEWSIATHTEDLTHEQMAERGQAAMAAICA